MSRYFLYRPGKTMIPMFVVTPRKILYEDYCLYRLTGYQKSGSATLEKIWSYEKAGANHVNITFCKYAVSKEKLYFGWPSFYASYTNGKPREHILEIDTMTGHTRRMSEDNAPDSTLDYHIDEKVKASMVKVYCARIPFERYGLQPPLEQGQLGVRILEKELLERKGDSFYRDAVLLELYRTAESSRIRKLLKKLETHKIRTYAQELLVRITMDTDIHRKQGESVFYAAYHNDTARLKRFLDDGADPDAHDEYGVSLLRYALYGKAPDALRLLFNFGADPEKDPESALTVWTYASSSPLRALYLELNNK